MTADLERHHTNGTITTREHEALDLHQRGLSTRTIALALKISRGAVRDRIKNGLRKIADHERKAA